MIHTVDTANLDDWDAIFAVNVKGTFLCFKYAAQQMVAQGRGGRLVGASSVAGKIGTCVCTDALSPQLMIRGVRNLSGRLGRVHCRP